MTNHTLIRATGERNPQAQGHEVILVALAPVGTGRIITDLSPTAEWRVMLNVCVGDGRVIKRGLKSTLGTFAVTSASAPRLYFVSHPWSGVAEISRGGSRRHRIDLYHPETRAVGVDAVTGELREATPIEIMELVQCGAAVSRPGECPMAIVVHPLDPDGVVAIRAIDVDGDGRMLDLAAIAARQVETGGRGWRVERRAGSIDPVLIGRRDDVKFTMERSGALMFCRSADAARVEISAGGCVFELDLHGDPAEVVVVRVEDIVAHGRPAQTFTLTCDSDNYYDRVFQCIDPHKPLALYVPRWRGVAMSTRNLFEQHLPVPAAVDGHPDQMQDGDILRYSELLLRVGCRHFVISGGDTFWLKLIAKVHSLDPEIRFDLLWHSNYLQMGEPHDWRLWTQCMDAYHEGRITRVGVVKEGYDRFLQGLGVEAVFIPNVVNIDPDAIVPSGVSDTVGIWLSGSSEYRKTAYASLIALAQCQPLALKASGMDAAAQQLISRLRIPTRRIWSTAIAPDLMHREMRSTAATLYVTLSECSPMLPLESLGQGVPCLIGPSSHLFRDDAALREHLVVEQPLSAVAISDKLRSAMAAKNEIIELYRSYAVEEMRRARAAVAAFLS